MRKPHFQRFDQVLVGDLAATPRGVAHDDRAGGDVVGDDGAGGDEGLLADFDAGNEDGRAPDPARSP